jgi:hypothetical protein
MTTEDRMPFRPVLSAFLGIVAPVFCIVVQLTFFPELIYDLPGLRFLNTYPLFNYGIVAMEILALAIWLARGERVGPCGGFVSGVLLAGSLFAGLLGIVLLPFSLIGLMVGIGILGLVPLLTSFIYYRNGRSASFLARIRMGFRPALGSLLLGVVLVSCAPAAVEGWVSGLVSTQIQQIAVGAPGATRVLRS